MLTLPAFGGLVFPEPASLTGGISLVRAGARLSNLPDEELRCLYQSHWCQAQIHPRLRQYVELTAELGSHLHAPHLIILSAASAGTITTYVQSRCGNHAHEIRVELWRGDAGPIANPAVLVLSGRLVMVTDLLPRHALEIDFAGCPLFVRGGQFNRLIQRGGGDAGRSKAGREIIEEFQRELPGKWMTKDEFYDRMRARDQGGGDRALERTRKEIWPEAWKGKRGRPSR